MYVQGNRYIIYLFFRILTDCICLCVCVRCSTIQLYYYDNNVMNKYDKFMCIYIYMINYNIIHTIIVPLQGWVL